MRPAGGERRRRVGGATAANHLHPTAALRCVAPIDPTTAYRARLAATRPPLPAAPLSKLLIMPQGTRTGAQLLLLRCVPCPYNYGAASKAGLGAEGRPHKQCQRTFQNGIANKPLCPRSACQNELR